MTAPAMRRMLVAVLAAAMVSLAAPAGAAIESQQPVITSVSIAFKGQSVDHIMADTKAKRYTVSVFRIGFDSSSSIVVNGQALQTELAGPNELTARLKGV